MNTEDWQLELDWKSSDTGLLLGRLTGAVQLVAALQGAARTRTEGAGVTEWEVVAEEKLVRKLQSIAAFVASNGLGA
jgi:hypothetical protein